MSVELQNPIFFTAPTNGIIKYSKKYPFYDINDKRIINTTIHGIGGNYSTLHGHISPWYHENIKLIDAKKYNIRTTQSIGFFFESSRNEILTDDTMGRAEYVGIQHERYFDQTLSIALEDTSNEIIRTSTYIKKDSGIIENLDIEVNVYSKYVKVDKRSALHPYYNAKAERAYYIDEQEGAIVNLIKGNTYRFDQSDNSNIDYKLKFYLDREKTQEYTNNVINTGTAGIDGITQIKIDDTTPVRLYYQDVSKNDMGYYCNIIDEIYQGELDYVNISISENDISNIRHTAKNLDSVIDNLSGETKPSYIAGNFERDMGADTKGRHTIEYYFYVWETINGPFYYNGEISQLPHRDQIADGVENMHNYDSNPLINQKETNRFEPSYQRVYTYNWDSVGSDFTADSSSNYISVYKLKGSVHNFMGRINDGLPVQHEINILMPKYCTYYFWWTYRIAEGGAIRVQDFEGSAYRYFPLSGFPPLYTPSVRIAQEELGTPFPGFYDWFWNWNQTWGSSLEDYTFIDVFRMFKPQLAPIMTYTDQKLNFKIPPSELKDLSNNFISRFTPDGRNGEIGPKYKTFQGDILQHFYENNQIVKTWFNMYVFVNQKPNLGKDTSGNNIQLSNLSDSRITTGNVYEPYDDNFIEINSLEKYDFSNNEIIIETINNVNLDFDDISPPDRGRTNLPPALVDNSGIILDVINDENINPGANETLLQTPEYFAVEYLPNNLSIGRCILADRKTLPRYAHILNIDGWYLKLKRYGMFPDVAAGLDVDISDNIYDVRWTYTTRIYKYDPTQPNEPDMIEFNDISLNHGISPPAYFDFTQYGKIYEPGPLNLAYTFISTEGSGYYKNLNISLNEGEIDPLIWNVQANTDLNMKIDIQVYGIKPKKRADLDQLDPPIDVAGRQLADFDISFDLIAGPNEIISSVIELDISDTEIIDATLKPGRWHFIWTYSVRHNNINPKYREYPLIPGTDYDISNSFQDIPYNDFFYDHGSPVLTNSTDLDQIVMEIPKEDIIEIRRHLDTYFDTLSDNIIIKFDFFLWVPTFEEEIRSSGLLRWALPGHYLPSIRSGYYGPTDPRIYQAPVVYEDYSDVITRTKVWLGERNKLWDGEPGYRYTQVTYNDPSNNLIYQLTDLVFENYTQAVDVTGELSSLLDAENYIVELIIPRGTDLNTNSGNFGFANYEDKLIDTTFLSFHIGVLGDGFTNEGFIYKPPYNPSAIGFQYYHHDLRQYDLSENDIVIQYQFSRRQNTYGTVFNDVEIWINNIMIYSLPTIGIPATDIVYVGSNYTTENPYSQRPTQIKLYNPVENNLFVRQTDLKDTTRVKNVLGPQDYDGDGNRTQFPVSTDYQYLSYDIPYLAQYQYEIVDLSNNMTMNSTINTLDTNTYQRKQDWVVVTDQFGNETIPSDNSLYPFEHKYLYTPYYLSEENFIVPEPYYPQALQCFYYPLKMQLWAQIPMPEMHNLYHAFLNYWSQQTSKTAVRFIFYIWEPGSKNKPENYNRTSDMEDWNLDLHDPSNNIYMYDHKITLSANEETGTKIQNIMPLIADNKLILNTKDLKYGEWLFAFTYEVFNDITVQLWRGPEHSAYPLKVTSVQVPPYLYQPKAPRMSHILDASENECIEVSIPNSQLKDLSRNIIKQLRQMDISTVEIHYYLWCPLDEEKYTYNGWNLPEDYFGEYDPRTYAAPVPYIDPENEQQKIAFKDASFNEYGYKKKHAIKITLVTDVEIDESGNRIINLEKMSKVIFTDKMIEDDSDGKLKYTDYITKNGHPIPYISRWGYSYRGPEFQFESDISGDVFHRLVNWKVYVDINKNENLTATNINRYEYGRLFIKEPTKKEEEIITLLDPCAGPCAQKPKDITKTKEQKTRVQRYVDKVKNFKYAARLREHAEPKNIIILGNSNPITQQYALTNQQSEGYACASNTAVIVRNIIPLINETSINVVETTNGFRYVFNGILDYEEKDQWAFTTGLYKLKNVPKEHPIAILNSGKTDKIRYSGDNFKRIQKFSYSSEEDLEGAVYDFYYGDIEIEVLQDFGIMSVKCLYHGYMGGQYLIIYSDEAPVPINIEFVSVLDDDVEEKDVQTQPIQDLLPEVLSEQQYYIAPSIQEQIETILGSSSSGYSLPDGTTVLPDGTIIYGIEDGGTDGGTTGGGTTGGY